MRYITTFLKMTLILAAALISGCATTNNIDGVNDPFEGYNRFMHTFNDNADKIVLKPVAKVYDAVMPDPLSRGVSNFFSNLNELTVILNDLLQLKFGQAFQDTGRFVLNSTVGVGGLFDVASLSGYKKHNEDFGQTLGAWGVEPGPYFVLPLFGPSNIRDTIGMAGNYFTDPVVHIDHVPTRNQVYGTRVVDDRSQLLSAEKILEEATDDEYSFIRDAYIQRRQNLVYDGNPPEDDFDVFSDE